MKQQVYVFDPTVSDTLSKVRGIGRYIQILRENFSDEFNFVSKIENFQLKIENSVLINPFFNFLTSPLIMKRIAKKQIAVIHDLIPLKYPEHFPIGLKGKLNVFLNQLALRNYDLIITDSIASKNDIVNILGLPENKVRVIYPCLPKIFNQVSSSKKQVLSIKNLNTKYLLLNTNFCLYVGDATWNKNLVNLAKAIKKINITCVFVGKIFNPLTRELVNSLTNKWQQELKQFYYETKDDKRFVFAGFVPDNELINLYQQARCNVLPSHDEGFGFSYIESASLLCPSVLSDIPVLREISGEKALFANPEKVDEIANMIGELCFDGEKRIQIGKLAYKRSKIFLSSHFKESFLNLLKNL